MHCNIRTDLAMEARESLEKYEKLHGIDVEEINEKGGIHVTRVKISSKNAARLLGKGIGIYVTIEADKLEEEDEDFHKEVSSCLQKELNKLIGQEKGVNQVLVVGLGNRNVTADSLGPRVVENIYINRHICREFGRSCLGEKEKIVSALEPGVMAKTGMEALEIIKGVVSQISPDLILIVDALAARNTKRLNRTIQISDAGILPGSGVGNHREGINEESVGVPVIAIGIPTVVDAATIVNDALEKDGIIGYDRDRFLINLKDMYMTGKDVDGIIKKVSFTISEGINMALCT